LPTTRNDAVIPPADARPWRYFTETGHVVQGAFLNYFNLSGGLTVFGYPRTDELSEDGHVVQYFQRARLEYVQARAGAEVVPALLGAQALVDRGLRSRMETQPIAPFDSSDTLRFIPETGHSVGGGFKTFYEKNGGVAVLGYPLSEEFVQDGVTVQYFQRAVLDYLPGKPVQVELLGDDLLRQKGWLN